MNRFMRMLRALIGVLPKDPLAEARKAADRVVFDMVLLTCKLCRHVRTYGFDPPLRGGEAMRDFMWSCPPCTCGHAHADVEWRLVEPIHQVAFKHTVKA